MPTDLRNGPALVNGALQGNSNPDNGWIVQKFGGTSVGKFAEKIAEDVVGSHITENRIALVCSARSAATKADGTTNRLLRAAEEALIPGSTVHVELVNTIREDHIGSARKLIRDPEILGRVEREIDFECTRLEDFLNAAQIIDEISPKTKDIIVGAGEKLSCRIMAGLLRDRGIDARYVNLDCVVPNALKKADLNQSFYSSLAVAIAQEVLKCGGNVPVVTGYFGVVPGSLLSAIGRGYTDLCAALLAVGLGAEELQIWKEVDGIFTADPRKVPTARLLSSITPEEAAELTFFGSEVVHPFVCEQVIRAHIPIRMKNVENPLGKGTIIFPDRIYRPGDTPSPHYLKQEEYFNELQTHLANLDRRPTAVTIKDHVMVVNVHSNRKSVSHGFLASIFSLLDKHKLVVDLISTSEVHISMALNETARENILKELVDDLKRHGTVDVVTEMAILSLVGKQMKHLVGIAGRMFSTLASVGVNIEMISQGASEIKFNPLQRRLMGSISCVIEEADAVKALNAIHYHLLSAPVSAFDDKPHLFR